MEEKQTARILLSLFSCVDIHAVSNRIFLTKKVHLLILSKIGGALHYRTSFCVYIMDASTLDFVRIPCTRLSSSTTTSG